MGSFFSSLFGHRRYRAIMIGLDSAGKSTILYRLKLNEVVQVTPTVGFNLETVEVNNVSFTVWDLGGQIKFRSFWRTFLTHMDAVIFVVDSTDVDRMQEARDELHRIMLYEDISEASVLVLANKQDKQGALAEWQVAEQLKLRELKNSWHVKGTCAITTRGLEEALGWLAKDLKQKGHSHVHH